MSTACLTGTLFLRTLKDSSILAQRIAKTIRGLYHLWWLYILGLLIASSILFFLPLGNSSHYIMFIVDNSGSMGLCDSDKPTGKCKLRTNNEDEYPINKLTKTLSRKFEDKDPAIDDLPHTTKIGAKIKRGLIEIGGESNEGQCRVRTLVDPKLNNKDELLGELKKIRANDSGATPLVKGLKDSEGAIGRDRQNPFNLSLSNNVIVFTDGDEDNCNRDVRFCEAIKGGKIFQEDFQINLYLVKKGSNCNNFPCLNRKQHSKEFGFISCQSVKDFSYNEVSSKVDEIQEKILYSNVKGIHKIADIVSNVIILFSSLFILFLLAIIGNFSCFIGHVENLIKRIEDRN
ncbi:MAG: VWA domain-containing protein [Okeania sp. SIO3H1]|nr:VWA domain-containing protein [Okeania sp. SIO3H1]